MKITIKYCEYCDKEFEAKRTDARFCSSACKQQAYLQRQGEQIQTISLNMEKRKRTQAELEKLVDLLIQLWNTHIKDETNLWELSRKFNVFRKANEIALTYSKENKELLFTDINHLPSFLELSKLVGQKVEQLKKT